jgi:hypothetical protein
MIKKLHSSALGALGLALLTTFSLAGCQLYFGGEGDDRPGVGGGGGGGWSCQEDADCAAGCYCEGAADGQSGVCEEAGFCSDDTDCPAGYTCDDRSSCVPDPTPTCELDEDCAAGSSCENGLCEPTCICTSDAEAQAAGYAYCNETRSTCETELPTGSCGGDVTCTTAEPSCPAGEVALIKDGCYTGTCNAIGTCDVSPTCQAYQHEADCFGADGCTASYTGINCTKADGSACQSGDTGCTCESFKFAQCL